MMSADGLMICVGCNENSETACLSGVEQFTVRQLRPTALICGYDFVVRQMVPQGRRCVLIEEDAHLGRRERAARCMFKHSAHLRKRDSGEPFDEPTDRCAVLEILEKSRDGNARSSEYPRATDALGITLYLCA